MSVAKRVVCYLALLILILLVGCGGTIAVGVYTNGFKSVKTRYIVYANEIVNEKVGLTFGEENAEITLNGAGFTAAQWGDYSIKITTNPAAGITCMTDSGALQLDGEDLTEAFNIERRERSFLIYVGNYRIEEVVKNLYGDSAQITEINTDKPTYLLTVTDGNGKGKSYPLNYFVEVGGIVLTPDKIVAG